MTLLIPIEPEPPWNEYLAWHPVWTEDAGIVWALPWKRVWMWRRLLWYSHGMGDDAPVYTYRHVLASKWRHA